MSDYIFNSALWSAIGFFAGTAFGTALAFMEAPVTTPEKFRRRQRIEGTLLVLLGVFTILVSLYFRGQDAQQDKCFSRIVTAQNDVSAIRSKLNEQESHATRRIISSALTADSRRDIIKARQRYFRDLDRIDRRREANPVLQLPEDICR